MSPLLHQALHQFVGCNHHNAGPEGNGSRPPNAMLSLNLSKKNKHKLASHGYPCHRSFVVLPSLTFTRWLFPLANGRCTLAGLEIYKPYATAARTFKALLKAVLAAGGLGLAPHRVLLASRGPLPLDDLVREVTGECQPVFSLSLATEVRFRKLTVQVMRPEGEILGYVKLPLTQAAVERVRHEAETLKRLWSFAPLRPHIPQVLRSDQWGDGYILFQSGGPPQPGPVQFNRQYEEFLQLLWGVHQAEKPGHVLLEEVGDRWREAEPSLDSGWRALGQAALTKAKQELEGVMIPCGVGHGDFAPWNARVGDQGLYVFDWESAFWEGPTLWDIFHFKTQVGALLAKKNDLHISSDPRFGQRASFLLYLLSSVLRLLGEESPGLAAGLEFRRRLLADQLGAC